MYITYKIIFGFTAELTPTTSGVGGGRELLEFQRARTRRSSRWSYSTSTPTPQARTRPRCSAMAARTTHPRGLNGDAASSLHTSYSAPARPARMPPTALPGPPYNTAPPLLPATASARAGRGSSPTSRCRPEILKNLGSLAMAHSPHSHRTALAAAGNRLRSPRAAALAAAALAAAALAVAALAAAALAAAAGSPRRRSRQPSLPPQTALHPSPPQPSSPQPSPPRPSPLQPLQPPQGPRRRSPCRRSRRCRRRRRHVYTGPCRAVVSGIGLAYRLCVCVSAELCFSYACLVCLVSFC